MGALKETHPVAKILYSLEKWIYCKADAVVFTMEGGKKYIADQKWDKANGGNIDLNKIFYINNGVDIKEFEENAQKYPSMDEDLMMESILILFIQDQFGELIISIH